MVKNLIVCVGCIFKGKNIWEEEGKFLVTGFVFTPEFGSISFITQNF